MDDIFTQDIKDLIKLATTDFDKFYKETEKENKSSGYYSQAASSGDYSKAASSGYYSKAASSGYCSKAASSGYYSQAASSGYYSQAASSGDCSKAASSGDYSKAASSGNYSKAASSGNYSKAASSGDYSKAASSGNYSKAASSGDCSACSALGYRAAVKGDLGNLLMASEYNKEGKPLGGKADLVDGKNIKANTWYIVENGNWVEVDFSDGIFHRVVSTKGNVKKLKDDDDRIVYLVTEGEKSAHGKTIKEARKNLIYKIGERDKSKYEGINLNDKFTVAELIEMYRVITGACEYGVKSFVQSQGKLKKKYTVSEIIELTKGNFGNAEFKSFFKENQ